MTFTRFAVDISTPSLWRVTFDHPPINLIDHVMIGELGELLAEVERNEEPAVLVFDSADPDYFLAHYDIAADPGLVNSLAAGPTGFHPWVDVLIRVSRLPAVTISAIRGRTLEILLGGEDFNGELAERYGYVNRAIPDDEFEDFIDRFARRISTCDRQALADIKHFVNEVSLPADEGFPPQMDAFWKAVARPALQARARRAFEDGLQQRSDVELHLGEYVGQLQKAKQ
jgi:enoyl-CoA hydratase/carnithine racemase